MKQEFSSKRVASIAGRVGKELQVLKAHRVILCVRYPRGFIGEAPLTLEELDALAHSVLTQARDKAEQKRLWKRAAAPIIKEHKARTARTKKKRK
jgi:hypothetical protein